MQILRPVTFDIERPNAKRFTETLYKLFQRNISFGHAVNGLDQNIDGHMVEIQDTGPANTPVTVIHNLGRIPLFIDFKYKNVAGDWYDSGIPWTNTTVFINFIANNMHVRLFIH